MIEPYLVIGAVRIYTSAMLARRFAVLVLPLMLTACVQRVLTVKTDPPGAIVTLNDREIGRTPFSKEFLWYGNYDVVVRKDGYKTLKTNAEITAPFWQWVPFDAITDFIPLRDEETMNFSLKPDVPTDPAALLASGQQLQRELKSSPNTVHKNVLNVRRATRPTTEPVADPDSTNP